jgi:hypothetical protein
MTSYHVPSYKSFVSDFVFFSFPLWIFMTRITLSVWQGMNLPPSSSFQFFQVKWVLSTSIGLNAFVVLIFFICSKNSTKKSGGLFLMLSWKVLTWLRYNDELGCIRDKWCYNSLSLHTSGSELFSCKWWNIIHSVVPLRVKFTALYIHM